MLLYSSKHNSAAGHGHLKCLASWKVMLAPKNAGNRLPGDSGRACNQIGKCITLDAWPEGIAHFTVV